MDKKLEVKCPHCKTQFNYYASKSRPFCSDKCKMVDLGGWFSESYSVASNIDPDDFESIEKVHQHHTNKNEYE